MIEEVLINDIEVLIRRLNELPNNFVYRGQSNAEWQLESTLERVIGSKWNSEIARNYEDHTIKMFSSKYNIYNQSDHAPTTKLAWLSVMQHYGVPTRLLDFTESPYIALYFALENYNPLSKTNFAVYAIDYTAVMKKSLALIKERDSEFKEDTLSINGKQDKIFEKILDRFEYEVLWITEPEELNARIDRQLGSFLISGKREIKIETIANSEIYSGCKMNKYIISYALYENVYALLRKVGINAKSIYGDLAGLAKAIKMELQVHS